MGRINLLVLLMMVSGLAQAQINRYMVFFKDKVGTPFSISSPENFLSERAIQRRENQNIILTEQDLPVAPSYVTQIKDEGITVLYQTKWMNGVLVECTSSMVPVLEALSFVGSVEYVAPGARPTPGGRLKSPGKFKEASDATATTDIQLSMLGMDAMHTDGYHGEGMLIAIMDAGFPGADTISFFDHVFEEGRFNSNVSYDFVSGGSNVFRHHNHGTNVWSTIAGFKENIFIGGAYKANFVLFVTEHTPTEYRVEEYNWLFAAERADSLGVDIINTSLGYRSFDDSDMNYYVNDMDGETAVITRAATMAVGKGMAVVVSAGNEGNTIPTSIGAPADAQSVLSVGAVTNAGLITSFSSIGPTSDGRIKPDVAALGSGVSVVRHNGTLGSANGTSFSSPLTAALVAGVWEKAPDLTVSQLFQKIRDSGSQFNSPDYALGYGIPSYSEVVFETGERESVFPNPTLDEVYLQLVQNLEELTIILTDSKGMTCPVNITKVGSHKYRLDLSGYASGLYLLRLQQDNRLSTHKIVKIR